MRRNPKILRHEIIQRQTQSSQGVHSNLPQLTKSIAELSGYTKKQMHPKNDHFQDEH